MKLTLEKSTAKKLYPEAPEWFKKVLTETFGDQLFKKRSFTEIKTFEDACEEVGTTEEEFNERFINLGLDVDTINYEKLKIVVKAINEGWVPDWSDTNQRKYFPWFRVLSSGFGFSDSGYRCAYTFTDVGSRLCFKDELRSDFAGKQFTDLFKNFIS